MSHASVYWQIITQPHKGWVHIVKSAGKWHYQCCDVLAAMMCLFLETLNAAKLACDYWEYFSFKIFQNTGHFFIQKHCDLDSKPF